MSSPTRDAARPPARPGQSRPADPAGPPPGQGRRSDAFGEQTMIFLHLPKTAGTTFREVLQRHPTLKVRLVEGGHPEILEKIKEKPVFVKTLARQNDVIMGHLIFDPRPFNALAGKVFFVSLLREPIDRAISHYKHVRRTPEHALHQELKPLSFDQAFARHERFRMQVTNNQVRSLCRLQSLEDFDRITMQHRFILGRQDRFDDFLAYLERTFAITLPRLAPANVAPRDDPDPQISPETMQELVAVNQMDLALFARLDPVWDSAAG